MARTGPIGLKKRCMLWAAETGSIFSRSLLTVNKEAWIHLRSSQKYQQRKEMERSWVWNSIIKQKTQSSLGPLLPMDLSFCKRIYLLWGFSGGSAVKNLPANAGDAGLIPGLGRSPKEGNGNPLQFYCLGNSMDRGGWWAIVHEVTKRHNLVIKQQWPCFQPGQYFSDVETEA